jgi:flagellar protein FliS
MNYSNGASAYRQARVLGSSREQLVVLLYDHLLVCLRRAAMQIRAGDTEGRANSLERASDIVFELVSALDRERGGEIASRLAALYAYFIGEISGIARKPEVPRVERLTALVASLHESWSKAASLAVTPVASTEGEFLA